MNDKDKAAIRRGLGYFTFATVCAFYYSVVARGDSDLYGWCGSLVLVGSVVLYLAAAIAFFPSSDDDKT